MDNLALPAGVLLTPGAGAGRDQPALVAIDEILSARGVPVERIDFPYRLAGRRSPDPQHVLLATVVSAATAFAGELGVGPGALALGGRSLGGRICSIAVAAGLPAAGLVLISYPLHPPGKPERLRTEHFDKLELPCLFVSGTRDNFATPAELQRETTAIPGPVTHAWIDGADHGIGGHDSEVATLVSQWMSDTYGGETPARR